MIITQGLVVQGMRQNSYNENYNLDEKNEIYMLIKDFNGNGYSSSPQLAQQITAETNNYVFPIVDRVAYSLGILNLDHFNFQLSPIGFSVIEIYDFLWSPIYVELKPNIPDPNNFLNLSFTF